MDRLTGLGFLKNWSIARIGIWGWIEEEKIWSRVYVIENWRRSAVEFSKIAVSDVNWDYYRVAAVQEKYINDDDEKLDAD